MPAQEFFRQAGFFVAPGFLDSASVAQLRCEMADAPRKKALVVKAGGVECLDTDIRKVDTSVLTDNIRAPLKELVRGLLPQLEKHFDVRLAGCESLNYLIYGPGDFFTPHSDGGHPGNGKHSQLRRVSAVIFLNAESDVPSEGTFGGGGLTFHGLLDGPQWERCTFAVKPEPGLLIAFPSEIIHEVTPVSHGLRFTVVTWFYAPDPDQPAAVSEE